jgi:hypothetical protein
VAQHASQAHHSPQIQPQATFQAVNVDPNHRFFLIQQLIKSTTID